MTSPLRWPRAHVLLAWRSSTGGYFDGFLCGLCFDGHGGLYVYWACEELLGMVEQLVRCGAVLLSAYLRQPRELDVVRIPSGHLDASSGE